MFFTWESQVRHWLTQDGWSLRQGAVQGAAWALMAEDSFGRIVSVFQRSGRTDEFIIHGVVGLDTEMSVALERLPEPERIQFMWDLRFELIRTELEFSGVGLPLQQIEVSDRLFAPLRKDVFLRRTSAVRKGVLIVQWMLMRKLAKHPPRGQMGFQV